MLEGRSTFPPVLTSEDMVKVLDWTFTWWTFTGVNCRVVTVDLFPDWKPLVQKFDQEDMASVLEGPDGPCMAVPIDLFNICVG